MKQWEKMGVSKKRRVTFHRHVTGVEDITMLLDDNIDLTTMTSELADALISGAILDGTCVVDHELIEQDLPHSVHTDSEYIDFSAYAKENG